MAQTGVEPAPLLAAGDVVRFDILDDDKEALHLTIGVDGTIQAPFIGSIEVAGMSLDHALKVIDDSYRVHKIFMDPKVSMAVETYQPVFVLGDVRQPGSYAFHAQLTVQKAVALAGGRVTDTTLQDRTLVQARIRGDIDTADADIAREAVTSARLTAALDGRDSILDSDLPAITAPYLRSADISETRAVADRLLKTDNAGVVAQVAEIKNQIASAGSSVELLQEVLAKVTKSADLTRADLERSKTLNQRGLNTLTQVSDIERELNSEEGRQLQVLSQLADTKRQIGALKSQMLDLQRTHRLTLLTDLQDSKAALAKAVTARQSSERQYALASGLQSAQDPFGAASTLTYRIRRNGDPSERPALETTLLQPGDVVTVSLEPTDRQSVGAISTTGVQPQPQPAARQSALSTAGRLATE